ncbi:unnamed protein product [Caenorhabditis auriculariae]|uniref:Actin maturation protease n=1 Tax=Caenorhabditis auriculariae TaxID=2777116 RepID=A0A8S1HV54_9PELO|nr:unnamed protein product [Caenorhabditis auriculariae]
MENESSFDVSILSPITRAGVILTIERLSCYEKLSGAGFKVSTIVPILQKGPQCGMVALKMALHCTGCAVDVQDIIEEARSKGFSKQGELYSVSHMADLANKFHPGCAKVSDFPSSREFSEKILSGSLILLPYDCDKNCNAVNLNGHKAHWLLANGIMHVDEEYTGFKALTKTAQFTDENTFVFGYQGKSKFMGLYDYKKLFESNAQLFEAGPLRSADEYVINNASDLSDLRSKVVIIS